MGRERKTNNNIRKSESRNPKKVYLLACEGRHTERRYFEELNEKKEKVQIPLYVNIKIFQKKNKNDNHVEEIIKQLKEKMDDVGLENDEVCIIVDRDPKSLMEDQLDRAIKECENKGFNLYLSNPCFELWLLLHFLEEKLSKEEEKNLLEIKGYAAKMLQEYLVVNKYSRAQKLDKKIKFHHYEDRISNAVKNAKEYATTLSDLKEKVGTNIHQLIEKLTRD